MKTALKYLFFIAIAALLYIIAVDWYKNKTSTVATTSTTANNANNIQ